MIFPRGTRSDIGFQTTRVVDDPLNYAKELPIRKSRNPKPQYKMHLESLAVPTLGRSKATGRGVTPKKALTPRRKGIISRFIAECSSNPNKYGRIGSMHWIDELANQINTPGTGRGLSNIGVVSHSDVQNWLDHTEIVDLYENLKETQNQQLEPVQPTAGTSGAAAKNKDHVAALPPKKRVRISSPSNWEFISPPNSPGSSCPGMLTSNTGNDPLNNDDGDTRSPLTSTLSSSPSGEHPIPVQSSSSCYTSSLKVTYSTGETEEVSPTRVTIIKKNLSDDDLREDAAAVAEQLAADSVLHQQVNKDNVGLSDGLRDLITGQAKKEEYILPTGGNLENPDGQQNVNQDQPFGMYHQNGVYSNQERNVTSYESFDSQVHEPHSTFSMQGMNPDVLEQQVTWGTINYNGVLPITQGQQVPFKSVNFNCTPPLSSPDLSSYGALNLVQNRGQIESTEVVYEERRLDALHEAFGNLHNSIDSVRQALNGLYVLNYQRMAPTAMRVFGHIVDSMISFYANYMRPDES